MLRKWKDIPGGMKCPEVKEYYDILAGRRFSLFLKRCFDIAFSVALLAVLAIPMSVIAVMIKLDSKGPVFYRQERITAYGRRFMIHKFRTMVCDADKKGASVTVKNDERITRVGRWLRGLRLDELPQLLDVLAGDMSFVGTRPELPKYVRRYTKEMRATLLLPAGITSEASIRYKDEADLLDGALDVDRFYTEEILPEKMKYNLESIKRFSLRREFKTMLDTVIEVGR